MCDRIVRRVWIVLTACLLNVTCTVAQVQLKVQGPAAHRHTAEDVTQSLKALTSNEEFCGYCAQVMAETDTHEAIPLLERHFDTLIDPLDKMKAAQVLVNLKDTDSRYWDYLSGQAAAAAESDAPEPAAYSAEGGVDLTKTPTAEFERWREAKHLSQERAIHLVSVEYAAAISLISLTNDPRAVPILRRALDSPVYMVQSQAASGLARFHDERSVPKIISLCHSAPSAVTHDLATALVYFDDPEAQKTVDAYLPRDEAKGDREARAAGREPF